MTAEQMVAELEAITRATNDPEGFYTTDEWEGMLGLSTRSVRDRLMVAKRLGRLGVATVKRPSLDGRARSVPAYRILAATPNGNGHHPGSEQ